MAVPGNISHDSRHRIVQHGCVKMGRTKLTGIGRENDYEQVCLFHFCSEKNTLQSRTNTNNYEHTCES